MWATASGSFKMNPFVANFRDVGVSINVLANRQIMREGLLYRGGRIEDISSLKEIRSPKVIVNLRKGADPIFDEANILDSPAPDSVEVYDLSQDRNKKWIGETLGMLFDEDEALPCFIHCAAGKDRTGVIVAALLSVLEIDPELIREEYLLSAGQLQPDLIGKAIEDLGEMKLYRKLDIESIRARLLYTV